LGAVGILYQDHINRICNWMDLPRDASHLTKRLCALFTVSTNKGAGKYISCAQTCVLYFLLCSLCPVKFLYCYQSSHIEVKYKVYHMLSYINGARGGPKDRRILPRAGARDNDEMDETNEDESVAPTQLGIEANNAVDGAILFTPAVSQTKKKHKSPQDALDEFWANFNSKTPGK